LTIGFFTPIIFPTFWVLVALLTTLGPLQAMTVGTLYGSFRSLANWRSSLGRPGIGVGDPYFLAQRRRQAWFVVRLGLVLSLVAVLSVTLENIVG